MLYLTYENTQHTDGAGSQLQRIICTKLIADYFSLKYIHSPITKCDYQGIDCLVNNTNKNEITEEYNREFLLEDTDKLPTNYDIQIVKYITYDILTDLIRQYNNSNCLVKILYPHTLIDSNTNILNNNIKYNWMNNNKKSKIVVAVHIRRGEIRVVDTHRLLPKEYYLQCINALQLIFEDNNINYEFHIFSEVFEKNCIITPNHHGILGRIPNDIVVDSDSHYFDEFKTIKNTKLFINTSQVDTLKSLINSDCLLASRSSFSYVSAILNTNKVVLFHPFWHGLSSNWIPISCDNDIIINKDIILDRLKKKLEL